MGKRNYNYPDQNYYGVIIGNMIIGTTQAAQLLNISTARLRVLLIQGRVEGAYKTGKMWLMPLFNGKPQIKRGERGPQPRWSNARKRKKTIIHVNTQRIRSNQKDNSRQPVITVKKRSNSRSPMGAKEETTQKSKTNVYGHEVEIPGGCRVVYRPDRPQSCGAQVWIETYYNVKVMSWQLDESGAVIPNRVEVMQIE
jgi:hypothetical protein